MIYAEIIADSINNSQSRIITYKLTYPRFIHSELMTHRVFSRNAASSRAIPIEKMISTILDNPAKPHSWGKNCKGMQASEELAGEELKKALKIWYLSCKRQVKYAKMLSNIGVHKQIANRLLEPFAHMVTLVTATEWGNFFNLRAHPDAQPEFQELAYQMLELYINHKPTRKKIGEWHLPFADKYLEEGLTQEQLLKIVTARAARVSYKNFDDSIAHEKDYELHDRLIQSGHMSPLEHAAKAVRYTKNSNTGNFRGWLQYRKLFKEENKLQFNAEQLLRKRGKHET
jgi:thymidylate synthase ThyX